MTTTAPLRRTRPWGLIGVPVTLPAEPRSGLWLSPRATR